MVSFLLSSAYALSAPSINASYDPAKNSASLYWEEVPNAATYNVYRKQLNEAEYKRINFSPVSALKYEDPGVERSKDYLYMVRAVDNSGLESEDSVSVGAPLMSIDVTAQVTTGRDKPAEARSIKTGKLVTFASPGDIITYKISYANRGCSSAKDVSINYDIPRGTVIAGTPLVRKGHAARVLYFDRVKNKWLTRIGKEENISRVKFDISDPVPPVKNSKESNGLIDLNVVISL